MARRGNNEGSIRLRKDGRWEARYTVNIAGGPKQRTVYGKSRADAHKKMVEAMADAGRGLTFEAGTLTLGEYLDSWLRDVVLGTVRVSTYERYESLVQRHLDTALGYIKIVKLTPAHLRRFYRSKLNGEDGNKPLAPATVHKLHVVLHKALDQAVRDGLIPRNVTDAVKPPRIERDEINPLTADEANLLLDAAGGDRLEALYVLAVHTGLRQGELLSLKWDDIDLEAAALRVRRTLTRTKGTYTTGEPKTKQSRRTVILTTRAVATLRAHLSRQLEEIERMGSLYQPGGLIFATETGTFINPSNLRRRSFTKLLQRVGLDKRGLRFHDLRHTAATLLLTQSVNPKVVSEMLGHASIAITLDTYSHVLPNMQEHAARAMEEALG